MMNRGFWGGNLPVIIAAVVITAAVASILSLLTLVWDFDLETSPVWQVGLHHLMLALLLSLTPVMASYRPLCYGARFRSLMLSVAVLTPAAVFMVLWLTGGGYTGVRDPRIFQAVAVSVPVYVIIFALAVFPYSFYLLGRDLARVWRQGRMSESHRA